MFDVGDSLRDAFAAARLRLRDAQASVAAANSGAAPAAPPTRRWRRRAQAAIFTEALLDAETRALRGNQGGDKMRIELLDAAASGMDAQRAALDVAARNVAAAEAAGPERRLRAHGSATFACVDARRAMRASSLPVRSTERGTNVDILTEMIAVMNASRAYESDASIFDVGKTASREDDRAWSGYESRADRSRRSRPRRIRSGDAAAFARALDALGERA